MLGLIIRHPIDQAELASSTPHEVIFSERGKRIRDPLILNGIRVPITKLSEYNNKVIVYPHDDEFSRAFYEIYSCTLKASGLIVEEKLA